MTGLGMDFEDDFFFEEDKMLVIAKTYGHT